MKPAERTVCFVTDELYPLTPGGIGRLTHNLIRDAQRRCAPVRFHILVPCWSEMNERSVRAAFGSTVSFHKAPSLEFPTATADLAACYPPRWAFTDTPHHADSLELMLELRRMGESGIKLDVIEFPDYRGWAFCTLQEKRLGGSFADSTIAVRLHSTAGLIQRAEGQVPSLHNQALYELEKRGLEEADLVVGHLDAVADENQRFYGFSDSWRQRVLTQFPPVFDGHPPLQSRVANEHPDLAFVTKVQAFKRPDLFVKGAALFMLENPGYRGSAVIACHTSSAEYSERISAMVPAQLRKRFLVTGPQSREQLMSRAIVVIPSDYESLNLTAYEASFLGGTLVLNQACAAFGPGSPFVDGRNCYLFDGTIDSLARTLKRAVKSQQLEPVSVTPVPAYYECPLIPDAEVPAPRRGGRTPKVSVLITNFNLARHLPQALASIAASSHPNLEVVIVDDASTDPLDAEILSTIEAKSDSALPVTVVRNLVNRGLPGARNIGLRSCSGDYVLPLDADDCIHPGFIARAAAALERHPEYGVVVPTAGYFSSDEALSERSFIDYACFLGSAPSMGMTANRFACATTLIRRSLLETYSYDERLDSYEDWSLYLRMSLGGVRFLVTNEIQFFYRRRSGSMVQGVNRERHVRLLARLYEQVPLDLPAGLQLRFLAGLLAFWPEPDEVALPRRQWTYQVVDRANELIKRTPIHSPVRRGIQSMLSTNGKPLRHELTDRIAGLIGRVPGMRGILDVT